MGQGNQVRRHQAWMIEFHLQSIPESNHPESGKRLKRPKWCASPQQFMMSHVAIGSVTDIAPPRINVRFTPESGHWLSALECPLCAKSGHGTKAETN